MARSGIQKDPLIFPVADYLLERFTKEPEAKIPVSDIVAHLKDTLDKDHAAFSITEAVRLHLGGVFIEDDGFSLRAD